MNKVVGLAIAGVGAYLVYKYWDEIQGASGIGLNAPVDQNPTSAVVGGSGVSTNINTISNGSNPNTNTSVAPSSTPAVNAWFSQAGNPVAALKQAAFGTGNAGTLTQDQWNYYYQRLSGVNVTPSAFADVFGPNTRQMTAEDYWTAMHGHGFNGLGWGSGPGSGNAANGSGLHGLGSMGYQVPGLISRSHVLYALNGAVPHEKPSRYEGSMKYSIN